MRCEHGEQQVSTIVLTLLPALFPAQLPTQAQTVLPTVLPTLLQHDPQHHSQQRLVACDYGSLLLTLRLAKLPALLLTLPTVLPKLVPILHYQR